MVRQATLEKLFWELRNKFLARSEYEIVHHEILDDINMQKKFENLSGEQQISLYKRATEATDGEATWQSIEEDYGHELHLFFE